MVAAAAATATAVAAASKSIPERRTMDYGPTVWADFFLTHVPQTDEVVKGWEEDVEVLKSNIKRTLSAPILLDRWAERLNLIDVIERLGLAYHFEEEIDHVIQQVYQNTNNGGEGNIDDEEDDFNTVALRFRLLRQHGYNVPSGLFNKFKTGGGGGGVFKEELANDIEGLLNLYEAGYLRIKGEAILDEAIEFAKARLTAKSAELESSSSPLAADRVSRALKRPLRKVFDKFEHLFFISFYEKLDSHDPALLKWWLKLDTPRKLPYARDKLVESYFWALGGLWEPKYSTARHLFAKVAQVGTLLDDTYDNQRTSTIEELELFTDAIERWDTGRKDLKDYMVVLFDAISGIYDEIESNTSKERALWCLDYGKQAVGSVARSYFEEEKRTDKDHVPTVEEYRQVSSLTTCYQWIVYSVLCGMGDSVSKDVFDWLLVSKPTMLIAATDQCRLQDDLADNMVHYAADPADHNLSMSLLREDEKEQKATLLECYIKQYGVSKQEAVVGVTEFIEEDWMIMNEEWLNPPAGVPRQLLMVFIRLARVMDTLYKDYDGYTHSATYTKDMITAVVVTPMVI